MYICNRNTVIVKHFIGAISSAGSEHLVYTEGVGGSNPSSPTIPDKFIFFEFVLFFVLCFRLGYAEQINLATGETFSNYFRERNEIKLVRAIRIFYF
jgi:hypothetical protein